MRRLIIIEILNVIVIPVVFNILLAFHFPSGYRGRPASDQENNYVDIIAYTEEMLLRFLLQSIMVVVFF